MITNILKWVYIACAAILIGLGFFISSYYFKNETKDSSTLIEQGQMIQAAITFQNVDKNDSIRYINDLKSNYLKKIPIFKEQFWGEPSQEQYEYSIHGAILSDETCDSINIEAGKSISQDHKERMIISELEGTFGCSAERKAFYKTGEFYSI